MRNLILTLLLTMALSTTGAEAESRAIDLHKGLGEQKRVGKLIWRGGVEMQFSNPGFGGISAMEVEVGGRTAYLITDRGELAEVTLEYNAGGNLIGAELADLRGIVGAGGRGINSAIEAIAEMPDGGRLIVYERKHRLMHFPRSVTPLIGTPRPSGWSAPAPIAASKPRAPLRTGNSC